MMNGVAGMLSEQDMMDIAAYYSIQTISENSANADAETLELGRKIYVGEKWILKRQLVLLVMELKV